ncbi:MAG: S1/P1 nuclease, partial [Acidobacteriota bacterium]
TRRDAIPTPLLQGFPDMGRHTNWHYVDYNFSPDRTPFPPLETPNALTELRRMIDILGKPVDDSSNPVYALPWFLHIGGDVHNPLHDVSRYSHDLPQGDRGGNNVFVTGQNLHAFWDGLGGSNMSQAYVDAFATQIEGEYKANQKTYLPEIDPEVWTLEGFNNARKVVYSFGLPNGSQEHPIVLSKAYKSKAKSLGKRQLAAAGIRLAAVLNGHLN